MLDSLYPWFKVLTLRILTLIAASRVGLEMICLILLQRQFPTLQHAVSLSSDISFAKNADPQAVAQFIHKLVQASGLELSWGDGPKRDIYPAYQALIAK